MTTPLIGYISLYHMFCYFFIYGFLGWVIEVIFATLKTGKFVNRGFLDGPICPIYGIGVALCVLFLNTLEEHFWLLFLVGGILASLLELFTGFILDKIFNTKWWDYSKEPFNIKGYVCLRFTIIWGLAIVLVFRTVVPLTNKLIELVPFKWWGFYILTVLVIVLVLDIISDIIKLKKLRDNLNETNILAEKLQKSSDRIGVKISDATISVYERLKILSEKIKKTRLGKAFPKLKEKGEKLLSEFEKAQDQIEKFNQAHKK